MDQYQLQLEQVQIALKSDPGNQELQKMARNLEQLVSLTQPAKKPEREISSKAEKDRIDWNVGDKCEAKYADGQYFPAIIVSMSADRTKFTVNFEGYNEAGIVFGRDLRLPKPTQKLHEGSVKKESKKPDASSNKKKKYSSKADYIQQKEKEQSVKQNAWQKFNDKAVKKGSVGITKKSIFSNAADKGKMTEFAKKTKHVYTPSLEDE